MTPLEPIPETLEALEELDSPADAGARLRQLTTLAERAREVVPDLVGVSIARVDHGLTLTLVATAPEIAVLDAIQYVAGGPCVEGADTRQIREFDDDNVLDEERWRLFAEATAARAVRSTLTLPVVEGEAVVGTVNLYAASRRAFVGHHEDLAEIFDAWAAGAITNADLSFATRRDARATPERIRQREMIEEAAASIAGERGIDLDSAEALLRDAAAQAGVATVDLARQILHAPEDDGSSD